MQNFSRMSAKLCLLGKEPKGTRGLNTTIENCFACASIIILWSNLMGFLHIVTVIVTKLLLLPLVLGSYLLINFTCEGCKESALAVSEPVKVHPNKTNYCLQFSWGISGRKPGQFVIRINDVLKNRVIFTNPGRNACRNLKTNEGIVNM